MALKAALAVLAVAVVGLIIGLLLVSSHASRDSDRQTAEISKLRRDVDANAAAAKTPTGEPAQIAKLRRRVKQLEDCLPELQTLVSSLTLDRDNLLISPAAQVSRVCQSTIYGGPTSP